MEPDNTGSERGHWAPMRRTFLAGLGAATGAGALGGTAEARSTASPRQAGAVYHVVRRDDGDGGVQDYRVIDGETGSVVFMTDATADVAFQFALDAVAGDGGTVVASADTFRFGGPATVGDDTVLTGQGGTRLVASRTGTVDAVAPTDEQSDTLPTGHDLVRVRGDNVAVTDLEFDAAGTQRANQAVQADGCENVLIANNRTVGGFQMGLSFTRCTGVTVANNEVVDPNWYGITSRAAPTGSDLDLRQSSDVVVANNRVSGMKFNNIAPYNVSNFAVLGNVVFDGGHSLIACSPSQQGTIVGNVCRGLTEFAPDPGGEAGIEIEYKETHVREAVKGTPRARSYDITVAGNQIDDCSVGFLARTVPADDGDVASRREDRPYAFSVTGNSISGSADAGIRIRSGEDAVVATNTVRDSSTDIDVAGDFTSGVQRGLNVRR